MNKYLFYLLTGALCVLGFLSSCTEDDEMKEVGVTFTAQTSAEALVSLDRLEGAKVLFTEVRSQNNFEGILNNQGIATFSLLKGVYNISIEEKLDVNGDKIVVSLRMENISVNAAGQNIIGNVISTPENAVCQDFIFSEIFFNGEKNSGKMMHPDQYFTIFNPTDRTLYADGVCVANTHHLSWQEKEMWYDEFYPDRVPIRGFVTVPGNGTDYPVEPGEMKVVAFTAIDHSKVAGYDHAVDLSGADFEIYDGPETNDVDNPEVPNLLKTNNSDVNVSGGFFFQPRGYVSPLMFKLENGNPATVEKFYKENVKVTRTAIPANEDKGIPADTIDIQILSVPTKMIIDGVQTSDVPQDIVTRVIPEIVDRGKFLVNGCHRQELAIRKKIKVGNKIFYKDTNNSTEDIEMQKGQNSFPKGWRKK